MFWVGSVARAEAVRNEMVEEGRRRVDHLRWVGVGMAAGMAAGDGTICWSSSPPFSHEGSSSGMRLRRGVLPICGVCFAVAGLVEPVYDLCLARLVHFRMIAREHQDHAAMDESGLYEEDGNDFTRLER